MMILKELPGMEIVAIPHFPWSTRVTQRAKQTHSVNKRMETIFVITISVDSKQIREVKLVLNLQCIPVTLVVKQRHSANRLIPTISATITLAD